MRLGIDINKTRHVSPNVLPCTGSHICVVFIKFLRFVGVGTLATAIQYVILIVLVRLEVSSPTIASATGFMISGIINYLLNYHFTFRSQRAHIQAASRFAAVAAMGLILNTGVMALGVNVLLIHYLAVQIVATAIVLLWNFFGNYLWSFRDINA